MKELFNKHPNLIKFAMFSMVILLLMVMVAIRNGKDPGAGKLSKANESSREVQNAQMRSDEQEKSDDGDAVDGVESSKTDKPEEESTAEVKEDAPDTIEPTPTPEPEMELEAFELLETDFAQLEEMIGKGIPEGRPNERYFMAPGASIRYDHDSELINRITVDGDGDGRACMSLLGVKLGDDFDQSQDALTDQGIDVIDLQENTYMCEFYLGNAKKKVYQIFVTGQDGKVSEMVISIK